MTGYVKESGSSQTTPTSVSERRLTRTSTAVRRRRKRRRRARTERRRTTSRALSQRAAKTRRPASQRTTRGPADSSSWSGTTPPSPTRTPHTQRNTGITTQAHAHTSPTDTHCSTHSHPLQFHVQGAMM